MLIGLVAATAVVMTVVGALRRRRLRRRIAVTRAGANPPTSGAYQRSLLAAASAVAAVVGLGGAIGVAVGAVAAIGIVLTGRSRPSPVAIAEDVAIVLDLIAGCLLSGLSMPDCLDAAAEAGDPITRTACLTTAARLRRGLPAAEAWAGWDADRWLAMCARITTRTTDSGAAAAEELTRAATRIRSQRRAMRQERVQRAGVWVVVPLGLCFLPAFVLVAVVPIVAGLFGAIH